MNFVSGRMLRLCRGKYKANILGRMANNIQSIRPVEHFLWKTLLQIENKFIFITWDSCLQTLWPWAGKCPKFSRRGKGNFCKRKSGLSYTHIKSQILTLFCPYIWNFPRFSIFKVLEVNDTYSFRYFCFSFEFSRAYLLDLNRGKIQLYEMKTFIKSTFSRENSNLWKVNVHKIHFYADFPPCANVFWILPRFFLDYSKSAGKFKSHKFTTCCSKVSQSYLNTNCKGTSCIYHLFYLILRLNLISKLL